MSVTLSETILSLPVSTISTTLHPRVAGSELNSPLFPPSCMAHSFMDLLLLDFEVPWDGLNSFVSELRFGNLHVDPTKFHRLISPATCLSPEASTK
jgi:hypothetical protein